MKTKRELAVPLIAAYAVYSKDAPNMPYSIRIAGRFFCSHDTADLRDQVANVFSQRALVRLNKQLEEEQRERDETEV